ncbi:MAG: hypothetical protein RSE18_07050 [Acinetobacter sp.]
MLVLDIPHVSISSLQKSTKPMIENDVVCVLKNYTPAFYTVSPEKMMKLIDAESRAAMHLDALRKVASGELSAEDLINLD